MLFPAVSPVSFRDIIPVALSRTLLSLAIFLPAVHLPAVRFLRGLSFARGRLLCRELEIELVPFKAQQFGDAEVIVRLVFGRPVRGRDPVDIPFFSFSRKPLAMCRIL